MTDRKGSDGVTSDIAMRPSDAEISQLLRETAQQYEECVRLADLADITQETDGSRPRYAWDNPIGLVVAGD